MALQLRSSSWGSVQFRCRGGDEPDGYCFWLRASGNRPQQKYWITSLESTSAEISELSSSSSAFTVNAGALPRTLSPGGVQC